MKGNLVPALLLVLFLALSHPGDCMGYLSDAFENNLHLRRLAEDARASLLRLADKAEVAIELVRVRLPECHTSKTM